MAWGDPLYVYFMRPVGQAGPVKIGCSGSPKHRLLQLAEWSPFPLEIVAEMPGDYRLEARLHAHFGADYSHHEWFAWSADLEGVMQAVAAGTFVPGDLRTAAIPFKTRPARTIGSLLCAFTQYAANFPPSEDVKAAARGLRWGGYKALSPAECTQAITVLAAYANECRAARRTAHRASRAAA